MIKEIGKREYVAGIMIALGLSGFLSGCSVQGSGEPLVTLSPESAVVTLGTTKQFALATGGTAATWSVSGEGTVGTISTEGLYTAPPLSAIDTTEVPEHVSIKGTDNVSGVSRSATAFLTTFKVNTRLTTHYVPGTWRADTYAGGQRNIAVYKDENENVNVYAVWSDNSQGLSRIWFTKSSNGGDTFDTLVAVDEGTSPQQISTAIAVDGSGNVYVVWEDYREGDADIFIKKYGSSGFGIRNKVNLGETGSVDYDTTPSIAVNTLGDIYVVWEHRDDSLDDYPDIYFARSMNQGQTFSTPATVAPTNGRRPAIAIDSSGVVYVVWEDLTGFPGFLNPSPTHIKITKIVADTPDTPKQVTPLSFYNPLYDNARYPSVAVGPGGNVYVIWERASILNPRFSGEVISTYYIDLAKVNAGTLTVVNTATTPLFPDDPTTGFFGGRAYPTITADATNVYVAWDDQRNGTKDIYFAKSADGATFTTNRIVNDSTGTWHEKPSIAVSEGKAFVIWTDYRNTSTVTTISPNDVFFAREE